MAEAVEAEDIEIPEFTDKEIEEQAQRDLELFKDLLDEIAREKQSR